MKVTKVNRYNCEFCNKKGYSKHHMQKHEDHCTMNPNRKCGVCEWVELTPTPMDELLDLLPEQKDFAKEDEYGSVYVFDEELIDQGIAKLRKATGDCPACILAAIRQKKIIVGITNFDYRKETEKFWKEENDKQRESEYSYNY